MRNFGIAILFIVIVALAGGLAWLALGNGQSPETPALVDGDTIDAGENSAPAESASETETGDSPAGSASAAGEDAAGNEAAGNEAAANETDANAGSLTTARAEAGFIYLWNDRLGIWQDGAGDEMLTTADNADTPRVAPDGETIAFSRDGGIWVMNRDGSDERLLVSESEIEAMGNGETTARLHRMAWLPGSSRLLFSTALNMEMGIFLSDDLHAVDVESLELVELLPAGAGGEFTIAPDGSAIAVVAPDRIRVVNPLGIVQRPDFPFAPVITYSEFVYYPAVTWAADASALAVVIPHPEAVLQPEQPAAVYRLDARSEAAPQVGTLQAAMPTYWIDPTLEYVAFFQSPEQAPEAQETPADQATDDAGDAPPPPPMLHLVISRLDGTDLRTYYQGSGQFVGWSPDGRHFVLATPDGTENIQIGTVGVEILQPLAVSGHAFSHQVRWLDVQHLLVAVSDAASTTVALATPEGALELLLEMEAGNFLFDLLPTVP